jgi:phytoene synthase
MLMRSTETAPPYDLDACVALMRGGSKSFFAASRLLPQRMRSASVALYAFCRVADDVVDDGESPELGLQELQHRLNKIYQGQPLANLEDQALALVVHQHQLPRALLDALLDGFAWDAQGRHYETIADTHAYGARVAGAVGAMMCWIMGVRHPQALARACELGVAMQLTNICRDVGEDARNGRLYLPRAWLREAGIDPSAFLAEPVCTPALQIVITRVLDEADRLYNLSSQGIGYLPRDCRAAIWAARLIYAEIGHQLRRDGLNPVAHRAVVGSTRKLALLGQAQCMATWPAALSHRTPNVPPLPAIAYLVQACEAAQPLSESLPDGYPNRNLVDRIEWMLSLFERLERERQATAPTTLARHS